MTRSIEKVAVIGAGTMGAGIAGVCAAANLPVVLLDILPGAAEKAVGKLTSGSRPVLTPQTAGNIVTGVLENDLALVADCDWICEVIIENTEAKRDLFGKLESARKDGSIISSNTSGIPLRAICEGMPERMQQDIAITHFFNPVHLMRLVELIPGTSTASDVIPSLAKFCSETLNKGVVYAKDTANFIGNRIGCFWILAGLHIAGDAVEKGLDTESVDALLGEPMGFPSTGLYGLVDLIGLDIMHNVAGNFEANLPATDQAFAYTKFPQKVQDMLDKGQLGRKTGAGFYKLERLADGSKNLLVYDLESSDWRPAKSVVLTAEQSALGDLIRSDTPEGLFTWELISQTLGYAADLVPEIADDIVNVDRALRWGFNWQLGPFELLDAIGPQYFAERWQREQKKLPHMLATLLQSGHPAFYRDQGKKYLTTAGSYQTTPPE